ncbi:tRNA (guanine(26)-N(2))-dimethyltransferase isoform X2 [Tripterygium wilfordii]|uniref:tRNA (guanine(26)-N(2))-dimethyltransferase isoform X2 n=1 Tax=Tripterygium wilfordii TaxID=458696 RepID=UPI0018F8542E|nr:tRNA (guanine(26)-N(2))-dimethyltransferase isoform X2 [Tripterygium wilfordii]
MLSLHPKTLFPSSPFHLTHRALNPNPNPRFPHRKAVVKTNHCKAEYTTERGLQFETGESFFRHESATGRDLGVLAAALYKREKGQLRVLDAMCGCGVRSLRYLVEAEADFVVANDANDNYRRVILQNLRLVESGEGDERRWVVTHSDANRILTEHYLHNDFLDFIDVDSFGSDSMYLRSAICALRWDGLLYITSTDGFSSGGHRPECSLAAYGAYIRQMPYPNEIGLRMLIGGAVREASVLGYHVTPLFSYYAYHGPIFRVLLQVNRGKLSDKRHYGFVSYCHGCGNSQAYTWEELGQMNCPCSYQKGPRSLVVSGPLWTGPLHSANYLKEMLDLAETWGWTGKGTGTELHKLLSRMVEESDPKLPPGYINMDEMASRAKINSPSLETMMGTLRKVMRRVGHKLLAMPSRQTVP